MFTPLFTPWGEHSIVVKNGGANREFHPEGINSPLGAKFTPEGCLRPGEVKNGPLNIFFLFN
jgi:hypothetical protein